MSKQYLHDVAAVSLSFIWRH